MYNNWVQKTTMIPAIHCDGYKIIEDSSTVAKVIKKCFTNVVKILSSKIKMAASSLDGDTKQNYKTYLQSAFPFFLLS